MRFQLESFSSIISFLNKNSFKLEQLNQSDKSLIIPELANAYSISPESVLKNDFFMENNYLNLIYNFL